MAHLDGEPTPLPREAMDAHLASCAICRSVADDLRGVTRAAKEWTVESAPATLQRPRRQARVLIARIPAWMRLPAAIATLSAAAAVVIIVGLTQTKIQYNVAAPPVAARPQGITLEATQPARKAAAPPPSAPPPAARVEGHIAGAAGGRPPIAGQASARRSLAPLEDRTAPAAQGQIAQRGPMIIRTALLRVVVKEFGPVRATVDAIVNEAGGFFDAVTVDANSATARSLTGSLRVPSERLPAVLERLRGLGQVVEDTQGSEEVTDQIVDLDARLASARATEQRLTELLRNRTGKLSDVLDVERELARVRLDIERLDAQKTNMMRRVTYATINVHIAEERKAGLDTGPLSLSTRIRVAAADGVEAAFASIAAVLLFVLRAAPSLLLWVAIAGLAWLVIRLAVHRHPRFRNE